MHHDKLFDWEHAHVGDTTNGHIIEDMMCALPPASMSDKCSQMGEPYYHTNEGAMYATWHLVEIHKHPWNNESVWQFDGFCLKNTNENKIGFAA